MKNKQTFLIQILIATALIGSWTIYQLNQDDSDSYINVLQQPKVGRGAIEIIKNNSIRLIESAEYVARKSPEQVILVDLMKEIETVIKELREPISAVKYSFFKIDETKIDATVKAGKRVMPIDYNSKRPVRRAIGDKVIQDNLIKKSQNTLEKLKALCDQDIREKGVPKRIISDEELQLYYEQFDSIFKNNTRLLTQIIKTNRLQEVAQHYDVCHGESFFIALEYEIKCLEWLLIDNLAQIMKSEKYSVKPIIVMGTEKPVRVGEPTELTFFRSSYIATDSMKVKINGRPIAVKDGIAEFDYRPTSTGTKYFKMDISLKNPFTGKMDNFSRTQKIEVID